MSCSAVDSTCLDLPQNIFFGAWWRAMHECMCVCLCSSLGTAKADSPKTRKCLVGRVTACTSLVGTCAYQGTRITCSVVAQIAPVAEKFVPLQMRVAWGVIGVHPANGPGLWMPVSAFWGAPLHWWLATKSTRITTCYCFFFGGGLSILLVAFNQ